jgi:hypothetical protein
MAAQKSAYLRSAIVKHILGLTAFTMPTNKYLMLTTTAPTATVPGTEVAGGSYARQNLTGVLTTESNGVVPSVSTVTFASMPAGTVVGWQIMDAAAGGNVLYYGTFDLPITLTGGSSFPISAGDLFVSES